MPDGAIRRRLALPSKQSVKTAACAYSIYVSLNNAVFLYSPKNQEICVQSEQTKQVADLSTQSNLKKVVSDLLSWARLIQKYLLAHIGQTSWWPFTSIVWGSFLLVNFIWVYFYYVFFDLFTGPEIVVVWECYKANESKIFNVQLKNDGRIKLFGNGTHLENTSDFISIKT